MKINTSFVLAGLLAAGSLHAALFSESFTNNPALDGWQVIGDTNLFGWDSTAHVLDVTWDSTQPNSYFYHPLGATLTQADSFSVEFDLRLNDLTWGVDPVLPANLAVGLFLLRDATNSAFSYPDGITPNLFEFDYFPDNGLGSPGIDATLTDQTGGLTNYPNFYFIFDSLPLESNVVYHVALTYLAGATNLSGTVFTNGGVYTTLPHTYFAPIAGFQLDTLSISSYAMDPAYPDALLAHGWVDNFVVSLLPFAGNVSGGFSNGVWQVQCGTYTNWSYTLEISSNLVSWTGVSAAINGSGAVLILSDPHPPADKGFYRVRANPR